MPSLEKSERSSFSPHAAPLSDILLTRPSLQQEQRGFPSLYLPTSCDSSFLFLRPQLLSDSSAQTKEKRIIQPKKKRKTMYRLTPLNQPGPDQNHQNFVSPLSENCKHEGSLHRKINLLHHTYVAYSVQFLAWKGAIMRHVSSK
jgi:hypothetical protein